MKTIAFLGTGAWGSALASVLSFNNHKVKMWGINEKEVNDINNGVNTAFFGEKKFNNPKNITASLKMEEVVEGADFVVLAVPSVAIKSVLTQLTKVLGSKKANILSVAKGFDYETSEPLSNFIYNHFKNNLNSFASLIGPSFAVEVFDNLLTMANVVGKNKEFNQLIAQAFNNNYFKLVPTEDEHGAEYYAAFKNTLAIGVSIANYFFEAKNTVAALVTIGVNEIFNIYKHFNPHSCASVALQLSALGDTLLTCTSEKSRNFSFGKLIAEFGLEEALQKNTKVVEGYYAAKTLDKMLTNNPELKAPFLKNIVDILYHGKSEKEICNFEII